MPGTRTYLGDIAYCVGNTGQEPDCPASSPDSAPYQLYEIRQIAYWPAFQCLHLDNRDKNSTYI